MRHDAYIVALGALVASASAVSAASCEATGGEPPSVWTMVASKDRTDQAIVINTSCGILETATLSINKRLDITSLVDRIESVPSATLELEAIGHVPLYQGADFSNAKELSSIRLWESSIELDLSKFPSSLKYLYILGQPRSPENLSLPEGLSELFISGAQSLALTSLRLPSGLEHLTYIKGLITTIDFPIPSALTELHLYENAITTVQGVTFPDKLAHISLGNNKLTAIRGAQWPKDLQKLNLTDQIVSDFEIRESDWPAFNKLGLLAGNFTQTSCREAEAKQRPVHNAMICVIPDEQFNELYRSTSGSQSSSSTPSSSSSSSDPMSSEDTYVAIIVSAGIVIALLLAVLGYRGFVARKRKQRPEDGAADLSKTYNSASTPRVSSAKADTSTSSTSIPNDVREDPELIKFRIDANDIRLETAIARGGQGVISKASWHGRTVAVKQMLPDKWHKDAVLASFMDEIRMCAQLDHPRVVAFVGIAWTSLRDLSVVTEFMAGGDLHALLTKQPTPTRPQDWTQPWTSSQIKSKTAIALDIAEAVVYLHSFPRPILHRDLKARNVLLDTEGDAKLSDFGISRVMAEDETMTSEVGTVAWIAPEVLRGERYSEQADVYSFGVVLVELDLCQHPYAEHMKRLPSDSDMYRGSQAMGTLKNTQIAVSVSTGSLRPVPSRGCPSSIASLVSKCVAFDPAMRPTAMQIAYELRQLRRQEEESEHYF